MQQNSTLMIIKVTTYISHISGFNANRLTDFAAFIEPTISCWTMKIITNTIEALQQLPDRVDFFHTFLAALAENPLAKSVLKLCFEALQKEAPPAQAARDITILAEKMSEDLTEMSPLQLLDSLQLYILDTRLLLQLVFERPSFVRKFVNQFFHSQSRNYWGLFFCQTLLETREEFDAKGDRVVSPAIKEKVLQRLPWRKFVWRTIRLTSYMWNIKKKAQDDTPFGPDEITRKPLIEALSTAEAFLFFNYLALRLDEGLVDTGDAESMVAETLDHLQLPPSVAVIFFGSSHGLLAELLSIRYEVKYSRHAGQVDKPCEKDEVHESVAALPRVILHDGNIKLLREALSRTKYVALFHSYVPKLMPSSLPEMDENDSVLSVVLPRVQSVCIRTDSDAFHLLSDDVNLAAKVVHEMNQLKDQKIFVISMIPLVLFNNCAEKNVCDVELLTGNSDLQTIARVLYGNEAKMCHHASIFTAKSPSDQALKHVEMKASLLYDLGKKFAHRVTSAVISCTRARLKKLVEKKLSDDDERPFWDLEELEEVYLRGEEKEINDFREFNELCADYSGQEMLMEGFMSVLTLVNRAAVGAEKAVDGIDDAIAETVDAAVARQKAVSSAREKVAEAKKKKAEEKAAKKAGKKEATPQAGEDDEVLIDDLDGQELSYNFLRAVGAKIIPDLKDKLNHVSRVFHVIIAKSQGERRLNYLLTYMTSLKDLEAKRWILQKSMKPLSPAEGKTLIAKALANQIPTKSMFHTLRLADRYNFDGRVLIDYIFLSENMSVTKRNDVITKFSNAAAEEALAFAVSLHGKTREEVVKMFADIDFFPKPYVSLGHLTDLDRRLVDFIAKVCELKAIKAPSLR